MNSEAIPHMDHDQPIDLASRTHNSAEIIDFSKASTEMATSMFLTELRHPSRTDLSGPQLADFINRELSGPDSDAKSLRSRLSQAVSAVDIFDADEIFDHKYEHDGVFRVLVERLQKTKLQRAPTAQREATLNLTKLRAVIAEDTTEDDETWQDIVNRLFT